jgi:hypothetical protein
MDHKALQEIKKNGALNLFEIKPPLPKPIQDLDDLLAIFVYYPGLEEKIIEYIDIKKVVRMRKSEIIAILGEE